jgi:hypothetical protein
MSNDILEPIRKAVYNAKRDGLQVVKIHITKDFKLRLLAKMNNVAVTSDPKEWKAETILGYESEVHREAEKDWWIETTPNTTCTG